MLIFWRLVLAYLISTFILQKRFVFLWKNAEKKDILTTNLLRFFISLILVFPFLNQKWVTLFNNEINGWVCLLLITAVHIIQDRLRVYTLKNFRIPNNTVYFLWDQFVRIAVIFALTPLSGFERNGLPFTEKWTVLLSIFIITAFLLNILIYFIEKDLYKSEFPDFDERFLLSLQRTVFLLFFLVPKFYWVIFLVIWIIYSIYLKHKRILDFSRFGLYIGFVLTLFLAIAARCVYFF